MRPATRLAAGCVALILMWSASATPARGATGPDADPAAYEPAEEPEGAARRAYVLWQQGYVLHLFGEYEEAAALFRKSIAVHPTAEGHTFLGWSLSELGRLDEAIAECKKAIPLDPDYGNPYNDIGVYLIELGRADEAVPWLEKAMAAKRYCCYQFAHFNLGRVLLMNGRVDAAKRAFERALDYDPDYLPARAALRYIRERWEEL
ncbi:MAG: tetratricopeptide repeat protein [Alphaproteobacteria bacterium]